MKKIVSIILISIILLCAGCASDNSLIKYYRMSISNDMKVSQSNYQISNDLDINNTHKATYIFEKNEKMMISLHLSNESSLEVTSVVINQQTYTNSEFDSSSTSSLINIEFTSPSSSGFLNIEVEQILYKEGYFTKELDISGKVTSCTIGVKYENFPICNVETFNNNYKEIKFDIQLDDEDDLVSENTTYLYILQSGKIIEKINVSSGEYIINNLEIKTYTYEVVSVFDFIDNNGLIINYLFTGEFTLDNLIECSIIDSSALIFNFEIIENFTGIDISKIKIYYDDECLMTLNPDDRTVQGLAYGKQYELRVEYYYNSLLYVEEIKFFISSPKLKVENIIATNSLITFDIEYEVLPKYFEVYLSSNSGDIFLIKRIYITSNTMSCEVSYFTELNEISFGIFSYYEDEQVLNNIGIIVL